MNLNTTLIIFLITSTVHASVISAASISFTPQALNKSGDLVHIKWAGVESPSSLDWLGIYSPPDSGNDDFLGYKLLSSCQNWQSGSGSIDLPILNIRSSYQFRVFRWTEDEIDPRRTDFDHNPLPVAQHLMAKSEELSVVAQGPEQIHLSFTDSVDEMRVMFVVGDGLERFVKYGREVDGMDSEVKTVVERYERSDMCESPANSTGWRDPGFIHDGVMKNLMSRKKYYYKVGSDAGGWSKTSSFISRDNNSNETIAILFGDMGTSLPYTTFRRTQEESISTIKLILRDLQIIGDKPVFISHVGDLSYARGYSWVWDSFFNQIEPIAARVPYHVCIGNHEYDWPSQPWRPKWSFTTYKRDSGGECGVPYSLKFNMPSKFSLPTGTSAPNTRNLYYSFDSGVVHFVYISTETNFLRGSEQYKFIKNDLQRVDRSKTPFVVVQGHRPMYTTSGFRARDGGLRKRMIGHLEPLLVENYVDLVLWGHVHRYERFCPMKNFTCGEGNLPVHVVIGMAGQDSQPLWDRRDGHKDSVFPQPKESLYRGGEFGYTRLVATRERMRLTYVGNHDGQVHDAVEFWSSHGSKNAGSENYLKKLGNSNLIVRE